VDTIDNKLKSKYRRRSSYGKMSDEDDKIREANEIIERINENNLEL